MQQPKPLLRDDDTRGAFGRPGFCRTLGFCSYMFRNRWAPSLGTARIANVWTEFGRGRFACYLSGPWNVGRLERVRAASAVALLLLGRIFAVTALLVLVLFLALQKHSIQGHLLGVEG